MSRFGLWAASGLLAAGSAAAEVSRFGCSGLDSHPALPALEGRDGVFYRIGSDMRTYFGMSEAGYDHIAALSEALAARGTTLVYVPTLTKSLAMPRTLPEEAALYGFALDLADAVLDQFLHDLRRRGVVTVDLRQALRGAAADEFVYYPADFHWTHVGARRAARAVAEILADLPDAAGLARGRHVTEVTGRTEAHSAMRSALQARCREALPSMSSPVFRTEAQAPIADPEKAAGLDIFGAAIEGPDLALIGTSFSASAVFHFAGFLAQETGLDVVNHAIAGGSTFGAAQSYLLSPEFDDAPPKILVWENPVYANPMRYGPGPMRELIAAARGGCDQVLPSFVSADRRILALSPPALGETDMLFLDTDQPLAARAVFRFRSEDGRERLRPVVRAERTRRTGRFFVSGAGLGDVPLRRIEVELDRPFGTAATIALCPRLPVPEQETPS